MATINPDIAESIYKVTWNSFDFMDETVRKTVRLNQETVGELEDVLEIFDELTSCGHSSIRASLEAVVTDFDTTAEVGVHAKVIEQLVLVFIRQHPANANKTITTSFSIPAPVEAIVNNSGGAAIYTFPYPTATGSLVSNPDRLGYLIGWLEDNTIFEDTINQVITVGGWTFVPQRSVLVTNQRIYDGIQGT